MENINWEKQASKETNKRTKLIPAHKPQLWCGS